MDKTKLQESQYENVYKKHLSEHKKKMDDLAFQLIEPKEFNRDDRTQEYYKVYERQGFKSFLMLKIGFKIHALQIEQEDLALFCFSLMQAEAAFPIKIFTIDHRNKKKESVSIEEEESRKDLWMETQILVSGMTSSEEERKFEITIYNFFSNYLLTNMKKFIKNRINWNYMVTEEYSDQAVIQQFEAEIVKPSNQKFKGLFSG